MAAVFWLIAQSANAQPPPDVAAPSITISAPSTTRASGGPVSYAVTYSGAGYVTLSAQDITLNRSGTARGTVSVSGSGSQLRNVTISDISGDGNLSITIAPGTASSPNGKYAPAAGPSSYFTVVNPVVAADADAGARQEHPEEATQTSPDDREQGGVDTPGTDLDSSGKTDAVDIQLVTNSVLHPEAAAPGDVDSDGDIDAVDIQRTVNRTLDRP
ncbi:MAG: hypothetical protein HY706_06420 [Candidatus Hydrogenedentes bacterium]|nr:hypothetical protein [Candidatus Hydrogenedentota bacterium]